MMNSTVGCRSPLIKLLFVADDQLDRCAFTRYVKQAGLPYDYTLASSLTEAISLLNTQTFEIAILDYNLGDGYGSDLFPILRAKNFPFVISTRRGDEETAARLMGQGAVDYLIKDPEHRYLHLLSVTVDKALARYQTEEQLRLLSYAVQGVRDGIYIADPEGRLLFTNRVLKTLCNLEQADIVGQPINILGQPTLMAQMLPVERCVESNDALDVEILLHQADGTDIPIRLSEYWIQDQFQGIRVGFMHNIAPLKQVELALCHVQENLEQIVEQRTAELQVAIAALQQENQERLKAEASLRVSRDLIQQQQAFLRLVIDSNPNLIFVKDGDGRYLLVNQAMADFYNTTVENLSGKTDADFHSNSSDLERFLQENRQIIASQQEMFLPEEKMTHAELGDQWLQWHKRPIRLPEQAIDGVLGVGVNITARKQIEFSLQESEQRFSSLAVAAPVGIFRTDIGGHCVYVNDRWCEIAGLSFAQALGDGWTQALHPDDQDALEDEWYRSAQENRPFKLEYRFQRADGTVTWVFGQSLAQYDASGILMGYVGTITDISDRKQAEDALRASEAYQRALIRSLPDLIIRIDQDGTYLEFIAPPNFRVISQAPNLKGANVYIAFPPHLAQQLMASVHTAIRTGTIQFYEQDLSTDDTFQIEEVRVVPYGENEALLLVRDISDRKRAELTLQKLLVGTATVTGEDFFPALVRHIAEALDVCYALVTEQVGNSLHSLGFWGNGALQSDMSYVLAHTPCAHILQTGEFYCESGVQAQFPEDANLRALQADGCLGMALRDDLGNFIGSLCILDVQPLRATKRSEAIALLQVFAARASAELQRKRANDALRQLNQDLEARVEQRTIELQAREMQLHDLFDNATDLIQSIDLQGQILLVNRAWKETLGYTDADLAQLSIFQIIHPDDLEHCQTTMQSLFAGEVCLGIETRFLTKDGREITVEGNVNCQVHDGQRIATRGIFRDITERKQAEATLRESETRFRRVFDSNVVGMMFTDFNGQITEANDRFLAMVGYSRDDLNAGRINWAVITPPEYRQLDLDAIAHLRQYHSIEPWEKAYYHQEGHRVPVLIGVAMLSHVEGSCVCVVVDISDRKQAEAQLHRTNQELARATRLKDEFLANMSHELRTPLTAILGMTEGLQDGVFGEINQTQYNALQTVEHSGSHLLELINDILDVAKIESGQFELDCTPTNIISLCQSSLAFIKQQTLEKSIQLNTNLPPNLPDLMVDERRIRQVLINLLNNAVKFTLSGGQITLEVSSDPIPRGEAWGNRHYLRIAVIDTGIGISPENIQKLFQPFVQIDSALNRQYTGTGLGLAIVKQIVELHGGQVGLTSEIGVGSCFTIDLPYIPAEPADASAPEALLGLDLEFKQFPLAESAPLILLVEDNEANSCTISSYLSAKGYRMVLARNAQETLSLAQSAAPDLILMDIQMPGMDGLEVTQMLRHDPVVMHVPIIALTALAMEGDQERCFAVGANEYLSKPVKLKQLAAVIQNLLENG